MLFLYSGTAKVNERSYCKFNAVLYYRLCLFIVYSLLSLFLLLLLFYSQRFCTLCVFPFFYFLRYVMYNMVYTCENIKTRQDSIKRKRETQISKNSVTKATPYF